jgi:hypothetical protein
VTAIYAYAGVVLPAITLRPGACYPTGDWDLGITVYKWLAT